jgi:hypothetical protein
MRKKTYQCYTIYQMLLPSSSLSNAGKCLDLRNEPGIKNRRAKFFENQNDFDRHVTDAYKNSPFSSQSKKTNQRQTRISGLHPHHSTAYPTILTTRQKQLSSQNQAPKTRPLPPLYQHLRT